MPLICDCRNLLDRDWEVHVLHVYCEANASADALVKRGLANRIWWMCIVNVPILLMYHMLGTWLVWETLDFVHQAQLLVLYEISII